MPAYIVKQKNGVSHFFHNQGRKYYYRTARSMLL